MFEIRDDVGFLLAKAQQRAEAEYRAALAPFGLTVPQFTLLAFLWAEEDLAQTELSARSQIDRTTMTGLVDRLERAGLVMRFACKEDRRICRICLTGRARDLREPLGLAVAAAQARLVAPLGASAATELRQQLLRLTSPA